MIPGPDFDRLNRALEPWPRASLAHTPTPLDDLPRLSACFPGHRLYLKRDDCTGLAMGGNKARQLEFYLGDALAKNCDVVLSTGAVQSNYMRQLAAAAARLGLECHIQLESRVKTDNYDYLGSGNVLLNKLFGAHIHYFSEGEDELGADRAINALADELIAAGRKPYIVPLAPVAQPKGALGYVLAAAEMVQQLVDLKIEPDLIVVGSGSGLTHSGLLVGLRLMGLEIPLLGACVRRNVEAQSPRIVSTCRKVEAMLDVGEIVSETDVWLSDIALAPGYGQASDHVMGALSMMARLEGVLVDPVYSAKMVSCTMQMMESGSLAGFEHIIMIHTGGTPALFAYREQLLSSTKFSL